jgi:outer membrane autotransporter protein
VFTGDTATADYTSKMASIDLRLVRDYQINKDLMVQPLTFATYRNFKSPSYSETGAGVASLDVEKSSSSEMIVGLGTIATYKLNASDKLIGSLNVGYDLKDDQNMVNSSYQGASGVSFETQGIDNGRWSYDAGVGYEKSIDNKNSVSINYNFQGEGSDYTNNVVSANYVLKF